MGKVMEELLIKAQRDKSKLVQVQRSVSRNGKTFMQNFWVQPSQVKASDKVIGGQQNLLPKAGSVPKPAAGVLDKAYFESIKSDRIKALDYLKSCGVTWADHSHAGINWMRAMQAYNAAVGNQNTTKTTPTASTQPTSQPAPQTAQVAQNPQGKGVTLTAAQQAEVDAGKNGKEKVVILKKILGNDGCKAYAKQLGISWNEHSHDAIDTMRMTMALKAHFDTIDGTVSPTGGKGGKGGGAPKGNQNAKKDDAQQQPTPPPSDKLEIPANATERQKNLINLINGVTDTSTLELIQKSGFVPEDAQAQDFVEKKLWEEYNTRIVKAASSSSSSNGAKMYYRNGDGFGKDVSDLTSKIFKGLPKKLIKQAVGSTDLSSDNMMFQMINPGSGISITSSVSTKSAGGTRFSVNTFGAMMTQFAKLSAYDDDKHSCLGVRLQDADADDRSSSFNLDKEGFVRLLRHIGDTQPELKSESEQMIQEYGELMKLCNNDPVLLSTVLEEGFDTIKTRHENYKFEDEALEVLKTHMKSQGFTDTEIDATLSCGEYGVIDYWSGDLFIKEDKAAGYGEYKKDSSGNKVRINLKNLFLPNGTSLNSYLRGGNGSNFERSLSQVYSGRKTEYSEALSEDDYNRIIDLSCKLFGTKIVDKTTGAIPSIPASQRQWSDNRELLYTPDSTEERAAIMMNLSYASQGLRLRSAIDTGLWMCPPSAANNQGNDMTGNYTYYVPNGNLAFGSGSSSRFASKAEELAQVDKQLGQIKTFSLDYHKKLVDYAEHEGNPTFKQDYWTDYRTSQDAKIASVAVGARKLTSDSFITSNPAVDLLVDQLVDTAMYCPQNFNTRVTNPEKLSVDVRKKLGHTGYTFRDYSTGGQSSVGVKALREKALAAAHCSLAFVDPTTRQDIEHEVKINFDRVDSSGKRVHKAQRVYDNRTLVFHSGVYEIKNSQAGEAFDAEAKRMGETPKHTYHGTSYSGACGIVGVDGRFRFQRNDTLPGQAYTGTMLGEGIYVAKMVGKNCPYIGNDKYSYTSYTAADKDTKGRADGVLIVCDTVFGKYGEFNDSITAQRNNKNEGGTYDSVAVGAGALMPGGGAVKEYECIVTRQNMVAPRYLVDCGARRR